MNVKIIRRGKLSIKIKPIKLGDEQRRRKREEILREILMTENA